MVLWIFVIYDTRIFCYVIHLILLWANEPIQGLACHIEATVFSEPWCYNGGHCWQDWFWELDAQAELILSASEG